jgi:pSer/pThr/pTyr-binding forkhead associated (FHA) protein
MRDPNATVTHDRTAEAAASADVPFRLHIIDGNRAESRDLPASGTLLVGRLPDADIRLDDPSVSRSHARIVVANKRSTSSTSTATTACS